jgi:hypothetical protein
MSFNAAAVKQCLCDFSFRKLFITELGWDKPGAAIPPVALDSVTYDFTPVAEKRGLQVFECNIPAAVMSPDDATRLKLERQVVKFAQENILIFTDAAKTRQTWLWVKRESKGPPRARGDTFRRGDTGERLALTRASDRLGCLHPGGCVSRSGSTSDWPSFGFHARFTATGCESIGVVVLHVRLSFATKRLRQRSAGAPCLKLRYFLGRHAVLRTARCVRLHVHCA